MVLQTLTHESHMKTLAGPAIIFFTSPCGLPQKEQKFILVGFAIVEITQLVFAILLHQPDHTPWLHSQTCNSLGQNPSLIVQLIFRCA